MNEDPIRDDESILNRLDDFHRGRGSIDCVLDAIFTIFALRSRIDVLEAKLRRAERANERIMAIGHANHKLEQWERRR